jgi:hypothetical protein
MLFPDRFRLHLSARRSLGDQMHLFADTLREVVHQLQGLLASE